MRLDRSVLLASAGVAGVSVLLCLWLLARKPPAGAPVAELGLAPATAESSAAAAAPDPAGGPSAAAPGVGRVHGRVLDRATQEPLPDLLLVLRVNGSSASEELGTDAQGAFTGRTSFPAGRLALLVYEHASARDCLLGTSIRAHAADSAQDEWQVEVDIGPSWRIVGLAASDEPPENWIAQLRLSVADGPVAGLIVRRGKGYELIDPRAPQWHWGSAPIALRAGKLPWFRLCAPLKPVPELPRTQVRVKTGGEPVDEEAVPILELRTRDGCWYAECPIRPEPGAHEIDVRPTGIARLSGRALDFAGRPLAGARVRASIADAFASLPALPPLSRATADAEGRFELEGLPALKLRMGVEYGSFEQFEFNSAAARGPNEAGELRIANLALTGDVSGELACPDHPERSVVVETVADGSESGGRALAVPLGVPLFVLRADEGPAAALRFATRGIDSSKPDGRVWRFRFQGVPAGSYTLYVTGHEHALARAEVHPNGAELELRCEHAAAPIELAQIELEREGGAELRDPRLLVLPPMWPSLGFGFDPDARRSLAQLPSSWALCAKGCRPRFGRELELPLRRDKRVTRRLEDGSGLVIYLREGDGANHGEFEPLGAHVAALYSAPEISGIALLSERGDEQLSDEFGAARLSFPYEVGALRVIAPGWRARKLVPLPSTDKDPSCPLFVLWMTRELALRLPEPNPSASR